ncbi:hypothetical protein [Hymenobacter terrestris]|uniref:Uncharacterized protein n=1 Tax=Hymenobacter terrestris TaxID=2748310 RepID=A0ABX2Q2N5_9BACT|nr:hypothetical protein [Hymenobacter terrestris]NVO85225.1 hypothetical protein [Hymenobacter terrestris]
MAVIEVKREKEYAGMLVNYKVIIDGIEVGSVANGQAVEFIVEPGTHSLDSSVSWCGSLKLPFEIEEGERKKFVIRGPEGSKEFPWRNFAFIFLFFASYALRLYWLRNHGTGYQYIYVMLFLPLMFMFLSREINTKNIIYQTLAKRKEYLKIFEL